MSLFDRSATYVHPFPFEVDELRDLDLECDLCLLRFFPAFSSGPVEEPGERAPVSLQLPRARGLSGLLAFSSSHLCTSSGDVKKKDFLFAMILRRAG